LQDNTATDDQATTLPCDRCGQVVETADMVYMLVPDSSAISALGAQHDGMRLLAAALGLLGTAHAVGVIDVQTCSDAAPR